MQRNQDKMEKKKLKQQDLQVPLSSSLGHLAFGDIAFRAWRKVKKEHAEQIKKEKE